MILTGRVITAWVRSVCAVLALLVQFAPAARGQVVTEYSTGSHITYAKK